MVFLQSFTDSLTSAATVALQGPLQGAYGQVFQSVILPQFDRSCQMMCQQISNVFQQGTRQCKPLPTPPLHCVYISECVWREESLCYVV